MAEGREFERLVANVVAGLDVCKKGTIFRNRRYPGIRQPGTYEVDISLEFSVGDALFFLVIVECKNWSKPVDRPVSKS